MASLLKEYDNFNIHPTIIMQAVHPYFKWNKRSTEDTL